MRRLFNIWIFILILCISTKAQTPVFIWESGSNVIDQPTGIKTFPGARNGSITWTDGSRNIWLFGGYGYGKYSILNGHLNDLWKYDLSNGEWTWVGGSNIRNQGGNYGTLGEGSADNIPGARDDAIAWIDGSGNYWLFGGWGFDQNDNSGYLNDLWKYEPSNEQWTWVGGSNTMNQNGIYGTLGEGSVNNIPGARDDAITWMDGSGNFWLFGGKGYDEYGASGYLNDLWKYEPSNGQWTWVGGSNIRDQGGNYGTLGEWSENNIPGAREKSVAWTDESGNFWLFGGL